MSALRVGSKTKAAETISFIKTANPDILQISPRAGGVLPISPPLGSETSTKIAEKKSSTIHPLKLKETVSKEFKVQTALDEELSLDEEDGTLPNPLNDAMYMFSVAISTTMMMAANSSNIPEDCLNLTKECLALVVDDNGKHPPNVQGILNHLKKLVGTSDDKKEEPKKPVVEEKPKDEEEEEEPGEEEE